MTRTWLFTLAESLGSVESLAEVPEKMTHGMRTLRLWRGGGLRGVVLQSIPPAERAALGISADLVRLSVGIEEGDDLVADVEEALEWRLRAGGGRSECCAGRWTGDTLDGR